MLKLPPIFDPSTSRSRKLLLFSGALPLDHDKSSRSVQLFLKWLSLVDVLNRYKFASKHTSDWTFLVAIFRAYRERPCGANTTELEFAFLAPSCSLRSLNCEFFPTLANLWCALPVCGCSCCVLIRALLCLIKAPLGFYLVPLWLTAILLVESCADFYGLYYKLSKFL